MATSIAQAQLDGDFAIKPSSAIPALGQSCMLAGQPVCRSSLLALVRAGGERRGDGSKEPLPCGTGLRPVLPAYRHLVVAPPPQELRQGPSPFLFVSLFIARPKAYPSLAPLAPRSVVPLHPHPRRTSFLSFRCSSGGRVRSPPFTLLGRQIGAVKARQAESSESRAPFARSRCLP